MRIAVLRAVVVLAGFAVVGVSQTAEAGLFEYINKVYYRNAYWPKPFSEPDQQAVRAPFLVMAEKGWERQNTLSNHHFKERTTQLNEAGHRKLRWIATQAPVDHRTVFVEQQGMAQADDARLAEVRKFAERYQGNGQVAVQASDTISRGRPGEYSEMVSEKFRASTPEPRLPASSGEDFGTN